MRAKFTLSSVIPCCEPPTCEQLIFNAVTTKPFDADGKSEDNDFARWTPDGKITMTVTNPNLLGVMKAGQNFYVDFTPVPDTAPQTDRDAD